MNKKWYMSKTVWGGILLAVWQGLSAIPNKENEPYLMGVLAVVGTLLTVIGVRDAL